MKIIREGAKTLRYECNRCRCIFEKNTEEFKLRFNESTICPQCSNGYVTPVSNNFSDGSYETYVGV